MMPAAGGPVTVLFDDQRRRAWNSTMPAPSKPMGRGAPMRRTPARPVEVAGPNVVDLSVARQERRTATETRVPSGEFTPAVRLLVRKRAGDGDETEARCESCGVPLGQFGGEVQHRRARGNGGTRNPIIRSVVNAALLCGSGAAKTGCHGACENRGTPDNVRMHQRGWWLKNGQAPGQAPVQLYSQRWVYLLPDGTYGDVPPGETA